jgi:hypothetical protein
VKLIAVQVVCPYFIKFDISYTMFIKPVTFLFSDKHTFFHTISSSFFNTQLTLSSFLHIVFLVFSFHKGFPVQTLYVFITEEVSYYIIAVEISRIILITYSLVGFRQIATSRNVFQVQFLPVSVKRSGIFHICSYVPNNFAWIPRASRDTFLEKRKRLKNDQIQNIRFSKR